MKITVRELAELVCGTVQGDGNLVIQAARILHEAQAGDITFFENGKNFSHLHQSQASAALVPPDTPLNGKVLIHVADPLMAFATVFQHFQGSTFNKPSGVDPRAAVHPTASVGAEPCIQPFVVVGANSVIGKRCLLHGGVVIGAGCRIGDDVVLHPNVVLYDGAVLGDRVIIHANTVIGADGFGYRFQQRRHVKVPQLGNVVIGADVEIGAGTTIDRGTFQATRIGDGCKIDNLVQIAHNCQIGNHNAIASQAGIAGSTKTGSYVVMGGQVGVKDHITVGDGAMLGAKSGVIHDVPANGRVFGYPALEERAIGRILAVMNRLPEMRKDLLRVLKHLGMKHDEENEQVA